MSQTFEMICAACHEKRWPYLGERPARYVCQRCTSLPPGSVEKRAARMTKVRAARHVDERGQACAGRSRAEA